MTRIGQKEDNVLSTEGRHPAIVEFTDMFEFDHLPDSLAREVSSIFHDAAEAVLTLLDDGPAVTRALHRLWEAKNEAVFHAVKRS